MRKHNCSHMNSVHNRLKVLLFEASGNVCLLWEKESLATWSKLCYLWSFCLSLLSARLSHLPLMCGWLNMHTGYEKQI